MKVLISAFSFALALDDANHNSTDMENSKIFQAIEMDNGRYSNYRNSLDRKYARSQERISAILLRQSKEKQSKVLMCWKCTAENMDTCYEKGEIETCDSSADSCGLEERRWGGILVGVELGCKTRQKCHSDISANFIATTNQCRPTETGHSVCRQCCSSDMCNRGWSIRSESGWQYDYIS